MPADFRDGRLAAGQRAHDIIQQFGDCLFAPTVDSPETASLVCETWQGHEFDAFVIVPTMATPPAWAASVIASFADTPVIVLIVNELAEIPENYGTEDATEHSYFVAGTMLVNTLVRAGVRCRLVVGSAQELRTGPGLRRILSAANAAAGVRHATIATIGAPIDGYTDVEVSAEDLARLGASLVQVPLERTSQAAHSVDEEELAICLDEARRLGSVEVDLPTLERGALAACVIRRLIHETAATAASINCHGPFFRWNSDIGVTGCLGVSLLAKQGVMVSCTGDVPAAIALLIGQTLAGSALYAELYAVDGDRDWVLVANGGEGDTHQSIEGSIRLLPEDHYAGLEGAGVAVAFAVASGPATLVSMTPLRDAEGGWRMIVADCEIIGSRHLRMDGPSAMVRFQGISALEGFTAWAEAGASHHLALMPGHHAGAVGEVGHFLRIETRCISH